MNIHAATPRRPIPPLHAGGHTLDVSASRQGWLRPSDPDEPFETLSGRFRQDGYLYLKGFLDRAEVLEQRRRALSHLDLGGLLEPGTDPVVGVARRGEIDNGAVNRRLMEYVRSAAYESFCMTPRLWQFMDRLVGGLSYLHKRKLLRHTLPNQQFSTPAHYDLVYLRGGTDRLVTVWIPMGDCPVEMGGLLYLEHLHRFGVQLEAEFATKSAGLTAEERISAYNKNMTEGGWVSKDLPDMAERFKTRWLAADYEAGDVMLHSPYMIHASTLNEDSQNRIRLSTDIRYQNVMDEIDVRWNNHWSLGDML